MADAARTLRYGGGMQVRRQTIRRLTRAWIALVAIGSRGLILGSLPQIGQMRAWPGVGVGWETFTSAWRDSMLGAGTQQPPLLLVMVPLSLRSRRMVASLAPAPVVVAPAYGYGYGYGYGYRPHYRGGWR